jgi:hypothetical protein
MNVLMVGRMLFRISVFPVWSFLFEGIEMHTSRNALIGYLMFRREFFSTSKGSLNA